MVRFQFVLRIRDLIATSHVLEITTSNPDVPSGDSFVTVSRLCLTAVSPNESRLLISTTVNFLKSSWIKGIYLNVNRSPDVANKSLGIIEKNSQEGSTKFYKDMAIAIDDYLPMQSGKRVLGQANIPVRRISGETQVSSVVLPQGKSSWSLSRDRSRSHTFWLPLIVVLSIAAFINAHIFWNLRRMDHEIRTWDSSLFVQKKFEAYDSMLRDGIFSEASLRSAVLPLYIQEKARLWDLPVESIDISGLRGRLRRFSLSEERSSASRDHALCIWQDWRPLEDSHTCNRLEMHLYDFLSRKGRKAQAS